LKFLLSLGLPALMSCGFVHAADKGDPLYARYACQQGALNQLKAPGQAKFDPLDTAAAFPAKDKKWAGMTDVWDATGWVDSQVRFGGTVIRSEYRCTVQKTRDGRWTVLELHWTQGKP
jgi:hypothetical protein